MAGTIAGWDLAGDGPADEMDTSRRKPGVEAAVWGAFRAYHHDFATNPDTAMVERGRLFSETQGIDSMVALGGGSSMDCAKGINFVLTNGGSMITRVDGESSRNRD